MGPTWILSAQGEPHVGPLNLAMRVVNLHWFFLVAQASLWFPATNSSCQVWILRLTNWFLRKRPFSGGLCILPTSSPFYYHGLYLISSWIRHHMLSNVWDEIIYPFPNVIGCAIKVGHAWISNFTPHFIMGVIAYSCWDQSQSILVKMAAGHSFRTHCPVDCLHTCQISALFNSWPPWQNGRHFADDFPVAFSLMESFVFWINFHRVLFLLAH